MSERPVVLAIPTRNRESVADVVEQGKNQGYDEIAVLDDASEGGPRIYDSDIEVVKGKQQLGPAGNRNRVVEIYEKMPDAVIHFVDDDMHFNGDNAAQKAREAVEGKHIVGSLVRFAETGNQWAFNYGTKPSAKAYAQFALMSVIENKSKTDPAGAQRLREKYDKFLDGWPNMFEEPRSTTPFWVVEGNLIVDPRFFFDRLKGFDPTFKAHEIQDIAFRTLKLGEQIHFDPAIDLTHLSPNKNVGMKLRPDELKAAGRLLLKYGHLG